MLLVRKNCLILTVQPNDDLTRIFIKIVSMRDRRCCFCNQTIPYNTLYIIFVCASCINLTIKLCARNRGKKFTKYGKIRVRRNLTNYMTNCVYFYLGKNACSISHTVRHVLKLRRSNRSSAFFVRQLRLAHFLLGGKDDEKGYKYNSNGYYDT